MSARPIVLQPADIVTLLLALDMLTSYASTQRTIASQNGNQLKLAAMQAMLDHAARLRVLLRGAS